MPATLVLLLNLGLMPVLSVVPSEAVERGVVGEGYAAELRLVPVALDEGALEADGLHLELDLALRAPSGLDDLGRELSAGIALGPMRIGLEGQPTPPFISNFMHAHEIRLTRVDPESVVSSVLLQLRVTLE